jgi:hypothetical protein
MEPIVTTSGRLGRSGRLYFRGRGSQVGGEKARTGYRAEYPAPGAFSVSPGRPPYDKIWKRRRAAPPRQGVTMSTSMTPGHIAEEWLAEAYELVAAGWCQGATAENEAGIPVDPASPSARRFSVAGAVMRLWRRSDVDAELGLNALQLANLALTAAMNEIPKSWNDAPGRRHGEVLEKILDAVSLVRDPLLFGPGSPGSASGSRATNGADLAPIYRVYDPDPA